MGTSQASSNVASVIDRLLDKGYEQQAQATLNAIASNMTTGVMAQRNAELQLESARLQAEGERLTPSNPVLRAFLADLDDTMRQNASLVNGASGNVQMTGITSANTIQRQLALPFTDAELQRSGIVWNNPDPEAVARVVDYTSSPEWRTMLGGYANGVEDSVINKVIYGVANGWSPTRTAQEIALLAEQMPEHVANTILRTTQLTAYRDATAIAQNANIAIIQEVIRVAGLDNRCCLACIALHGTVIWSGTGTIPRVDDHHNGRCTSVVRVVGNDQLRVRTGEQWFNSLPDNRQMQIAGNANYNALRAGRVKLADYVERTDDPVFGEMVVEASLKGLIGEDARQYYRRG